MHHELVIIIAIISSFIVSSFNFNRSFNTRHFHGLAKGGSSESLLLHATKSHKVTVRHDGKEHELFVSEDVSILEAALDAGIDIPHDCRLGVCLTCPSMLVSGKIDQSGSSLDESVMNDGFVLTCCAYPRSDLVIRSIDEEELLEAQFNDRKTG